MTLTLSIGQVRRSRARPWSKFKITGGKCSFSTESESDSEN